MVTWQDQKFAELARQLTYSPAEKRRAQIDAAAELLEQVQVGETYPWEFVLFRVTGYRPKEPIDHIISGRVLRGEIAKLVEFLSDSLNLRSDQAGEPVLSLEQITRQFNVSTKTIQRWRRQGLIAERYIYPDGRHRLGFLQSRVERFAKTNEERIQEAARFRQISAGERARLIRWAKRLAVHTGSGSGSMKEITRRVARHFRRSEEAVRYTIRKYDQTHSDDPVFREFGGPIRASDRQLILEYFNRGMPVDLIARRYLRARSSIYRVVSHQRAVRLKSEPIDYVANPLFEHPDAEQVILAPIPPLVQ
ncbi:MAG: hypothetical protein WCI73_11925, partial [Phycisphaerae bacterium]